MSTIKPGETVYRVLYKFESQGEAELSCNVGELLVSNGSPQDDWLRVSKITDRSTSGFVPYSFIREERLDQLPKEYLNNSVSHSPKHHDQQQEARKLKRASRISSFAQNAPSSSPQQQQQQQQQQHHSVHFEPKTEPMQNASDFQQQNNTIYMEHSFSQRIQDMIESRKRSYQKLMDGINTTQEELTHLQSVNNQLIHKMNKLHDEIQHEKTQMTEM